MNGYRNNRNRNNRNTNAASHRCQMSPREDARRTTRRGQAASWAHAVGRTRRAIVPSKGLCARAPRDGGPVWPTPHPSPPPSLPSTLYLQRYSISYKYKVFSLYKIILFHFSLQSFIVLLLLWKSIIPFPFLPYYFVAAPPHLQSLPYCITFARPLRNIRPPPTDPPFVCHIPIIYHTIYW